MRIIEGHRIDSEAWADLVKRSQVATWFQTKEAFTFFDSLSFMEAFAIGVESRGQLKGLVVGYIQRDGGRLKRFFSRRAIILGGPLLSTNITKDEFDFLVKSIRDNLRKKVIFIEIRNFNDYSPWQSVYSQLGFAYESHYNILVDTSSMEVITEKLDRNRRRNIKKALDNGVVIDENPNMEDLKHYYLMLNKLYSTKVKTPLFPYEFFERLKLCKSSLFMMAKNPNGELIGGLVCVVFDKQTVYAWMACGDDVNNRVLSPSVIVNYAGICYAAKHGIPRFDFMGAGKPDDGGYGVRDFKLKFGGELVEFGRNIYVCNRVFFNVGKLGVKIIKKL